jgi:hypothetical protein
VKYRPHINEAVIVLAAAGGMIALLTALTWNLFA